MGLIKRIESLNEVNINRIIAILFSIFLVYIIELGDIIIGKTPTTFLEPILLIIGYFVALQLIKLYSTLLKYFTFKINKSKLKNPKKTGLSALFTFSITSGGVTLVLFLLWIVFFIVSIKSFGDYRNYIEMFRRLNPLIITIGIILGVIATFIIQTLSLQKIEKISKKSSYLISFVVIAVTAVIVWLFIKIMSFITTLTFF